MSRLPAEPLEIDELADDAAERDAGDSDAVDPDAPKPDASVDPTAAGAAAPDPTATAQNAIARAAAERTVTPFLGAGLADRFDTGPGGLHPHFSTPAPARPARIALARKSTEPLRLEDEVSGACVEVTLRDAREAVAEAADGYLVYRHAHASGASLLHRALPEGNEDFLSFDERPGAPTVAYQLTLLRGVSGLRLVANTLEMLDADGAPRLRVSPPSIMGADGSLVEATLAIDECAFSDDPAAPWGKPVIAPGADSCIVRVSWPSEAVTYPALLDPKWSTTGSMTVARQGHTLTVLSTGKVLVTGGATSGTTAVASAELYDPSTGVWTATASMTGARRLHTATQLGTSTNRRRAAKCSSLAGSAAPRR